MNPGLVLFDPLAKLVDLFNSIVFLGDEQLYIVVQSLRVLNEIVVEELVVELLGVLDI